MFLTAGGVDTPTAKRNFLNCFGFIVRRIEEQGNNSVGSPLSTLQKAAGYRAAAFTPGGRNGGPERAFDGKRRMQLETRQQSHRTERRQAWRAGWIGWRGVGVVAAFLVR